MKKRATPTKPATPVSKRTESDHGRASPDDVGPWNCRMSSNWDAQRETQPDELPESDAQLIDEGDAEAESTAALRSAGRAA